MDNPVDPALEVYEEILRRLGLPGDSSNSISGSISRKLSHAREAWEHVSLVAAVMALVRRRAAQRKAAIWELTEDDREILITQIEDCTPNRELARWAVGRALSELSPRI